MPESKRVLVVDPESPSRRKAIESIAKELRLVVTTTLGSGDLVGAIGHNPDLQNLMNEGVRIDAPVVHYRGTQFEVRAEGHYPFPRKIKRNEKAVAAVRDLLAKVLVWFRDGGDPPGFLLTGPDLLAPLLPFGVLLEGYLHLGPSDPAQWFKLAIEAETNLAEAAGALPQDETYWEELRGAENAVHRIRDLLFLPEEALHGFRGIVASAPAQRWLPTDLDLRVTADVGRAAATLYECACRAVEEAWNALCSEWAQGVPRDNEELRILVEEASIGFGVLAAGHL